MHGVCAIVWVVWQEQGATEQPSKRYFEFMPLNDLIRKYQFRKSMSAEERERGTPSSYTHTHKGSSIHTQTQTQMHGHIDRQTHTAFLVCGPSHVRVVGVVPAQADW
jgi:hypothetical protein